MGKLIRDRVPELLGDQAGQYRQLSIAEFEAVLRIKLQEEVNEYLDSGEVLELADILEVVHALASLDAVSPSELESLRAEKVRARGGFAERLWWESEDEHA